MNARCRNRRWKTQSACSECNHPIGSFGLVSHRNRLSDLQVNQPRFDSVAQQGIHDAIHEFDMHQLQPGDVDRDGHKTNPPIFPDLELPADLLNHPLAERNNQACLLGDGNEPSRADGSILGMIEPQQRFQPVDGPVKGVERLVGQMEPASFQLQAHIRFELYLLFRRAVEFR